MSEESVSVGSTVKSLSSSFWVANIMEIIERMAWYGFYALSSIYMCDAISDGGLGLTSSDRGIIQGVVSFLIYLFPFVTGALGDRYGYKKMPVQYYRSSGGDAAGSQCLQEWSAGLHVVFRRQR